MAGSFLASAGRKTTDIRGFLREAASGGNSLRYRAEAGKKHFVYIPGIMVEETDDLGNVVTKKQLVALSGMVHDMIDSQGKYRACVCSKGVIRQTETGDYINDGSCPMCDRITDSWDIRNYRVEEEKSKTNMTGDALTKHIDDVKRRFADELKVKKQKDYVYILIALFRTGADNKPIIGEDGLPEYDLKVAKWSAARADKIQQQIENSGDEFAGTEMIFEYPNVKDIMQVVGQSTTSPVFPQSRFTNIFPALKDKITEEATKFQWAGIEKVYTEWEGMGTAEANETIGKMFKAWDDFLEEKEVNPNAKYLEYVGITGDEQSNPTLGANVAPGAPQIGADSSNFGAPQAGFAAPQPGVGNAPVQMPGTQQAQPTLPMGDANQVFSGMDLNNI